MKLTNIILLIVGFLILLGLFCFVIGESLYTPIVTFNTGHISPHMEGRTDFQKYKSSCRQLENMLITPQGPVTKRPGTKYIDTAGGVP